MYIDTARIVEKADEIVETCRSHDPFKIADDLGIVISDRKFKEQLGATVTILDVPFIFVKDDLDPRMTEIVLLHEIAHCVLHSQDVAGIHVLEDGLLFGLNNRMEYEANIFTAQISLPDEEFFELLRMGYDAQQIANSLDSDVNLVALKVDVLIQQGYNLPKLDYYSKFLG